MKRPVWILVALVALALMAQTPQPTVITGLTELGVVDATGATVTKPSRTVSSNQSGSCTNSNEIVINSTNGNLYGCVAGTWTALGGGSVGTTTDPTNITYSEEFEGGACAINDFLGMNRLFWVNATSGVPVLTCTADAADNYTLVATSTGASDTAIVYTRNSVIWNSSTTTTQVSFRIKMSDALTTYGFITGWGDYSSTSDVAPANGAYIKKQVADTSFYGYTSSGGSTTSPALISAVPVTDTWYQIKRNSANVEFRTGSTYAAMKAATPVISTTNIPNSTAAKYTFTMWNSGAASHSMKLDYFEYSPGFAAR